MANTPKTLFDYYASKGERLPSVDERRNALGLGSDYVGTKEQNDAALAKLLSTSAPAPVAPPSSTGGAPAPTPTKRDLSGYMGAADPVDSVLESLIQQNKSTFEKKVDEKQIRKKTMAQFQAEFDAIDRLYKDVLNNRLEAEKPNEEARFDGLRASQARGGLIGSGRGSGQIATVDSYNKSIRDSIAQEVSIQKNNEINKLMGLARQASTDEIAAQKAAKAGAADDYIKYLGTQQERKKASTNSFIARMIAAGIDVEDLTPEELAEAAKNLKVSTLEITDAYQEATKEGRANSQKITRQNAILAAYKQGITNPSDLLDVLNYNDAGELIGDITLKEITDTLTESRGKTSNVSEGTAIVDAFGNVIFKNPKTYKPESGGDGWGGGGTPVSIPSYEEWKASSAGAQALDMIEQEKQMNLTPEAADQELRAVYEEAAAAVRSQGSGISTGRLTAEDKQNLTQAGLQNSDAQAQAYFMQTDPKFRQFFARGVITGDFPAGASVDEIDGAYTEWYATESGDDVDLDF